VAVIEEGCRGIDVASSVAQTHASFRERDVLVLETL
jgi:hypothetical protein